LLRYLLGRSEDITLKSVIRSNSARQFNRFGTGCSQSSNNIWWQISKSEPVFTPLVRFFMTGETGFRVQGSSLIHLNMEIYDW
jgi:hypothetical protein